MQRGQEWADRSQIFENTKADVASLVGLAEIKICGNLHPTILSVGVTFRMTERLTATEI